MEERVSGFRLRGSWTDVVEFGERVTEAFRDAGVSGEAFEEWESWRPKAHERLGEEMRTKTAEQARTEAGAEESPGADLQRAGQKLRAASEELRDDGTEEAAERAAESVDYAARAADTAGREALRAMESAVYENVMVPVTPHYFDNDLVSANVRRTREGDYVFEVDVNDDDLKDEVSARLAEYEDVERWHLTVQTETSAHERAEKAETDD
ncbi:MAG: DUF5828 family protein [Halobacteriaceae archaeon]